jgi:Protein of unknown function (DUF3788)
MAENEILLTDRNIFPSDEIIFSIIGEKKGFWNVIMKFMADNYIGSAGEWNFYNDGKRWLFKMVYKKKTVFWATILTNGFNVTFYMGNKAEPVIESSDLPVDLKEEFKTAKRYGLIRPLTFTVTSKEDLKNILKVIDIKVKLCRLTPDA